jgi:hypothetical protein
LTIRGGVNRRGRIASVVSFMPGSYTFRMLSGLIRLPGNASPNLLAATVPNGADATLMVVGMAVGLTVPMCVRDMVPAAGARRGYQQQARSKLLEASLVHFVEMLAS